ATDVLCRDGTLTAILTARSRARRREPGGPNAHADVSAAAWQASRRTRRAGGDSHVGVTAESTVSIGKHTDRQLRGTARRPVRGGRLLPVRDVRLLRNDGHSDRPGARLSTG